jgi:hypothetical protein
MGGALRGLGFETAVEENVDKLAFTRAWQKLLNRLEPGDTAALFFAGHGRIAPIRSRRLSPAPGERPYRCNAADALLHPTIVRRGPPTGTTAAMDRTGPHANARMPGPEAVPWGQTRRV